MQININKFLCIFVDFNQYTMPRERLFVLQIAPDGFLDDLQDGGNGNPRLVAKWAVSKPKIRFTYLYRMV